MSFSTKWRTECPLLAAFMDGAAHDNSLPIDLVVTKMDQPDRITAQAEEELMALLGESLPATKGQLDQAYWLGQQADAGYTMYLPDNGSDGGAGPAPGVMMCYKILDEEY